MIPVKILRPGVTEGHVGMIPCWLDEADPRPAAEQLDARYGHGGGWRPFKGFRLLDDDSLRYPGDPPLRPIAELRLREELVLIYPHAWVAIIQSDRTFEVCRMD
jgi:hypothetical protein